MQRLLDGVLDFARKHGLSWEVEALQIEQTDTMSLALENICYNQPTQPGFYFGPDLFGSGTYFRGTYFPELKTVPK